MSDSTELVKLATTTGYKESSMDARNRWPLAIVLLTLLGMNLGANYRTPNFVVTAADPNFAAQVGQAAEAYRASLAIEWLGHELPPWDEPCSLVVNLHRDAFGATTFAFSGPRGERGRPFGWEMEVNGSPERILDSVLPHEITHTILASHFQQRLPRWLDEGASSNCEHVSETSKQEHNLIVFLKEGRGIPFNRMFRMMEYPRDQRDMLALYAQGLSVVRFLLLQGTKADFLEFVEQGLAQGAWDAAILDVYGFADLSDLQVTWNEWVRQGSPDYRNDQRLAALFVPSVRAQSNARQATPDAPPSRAPGSLINGDARFAWASNGNSIASNPLLQSDLERGPGPMPSRTMPANSFLFSPPQGAPMSTAAAPISVAYNNGPSARQDISSTQVVGQELGPRIGADLTDSWYYQRRLGRDARLQSPAIDRVESERSLNQTYGAWAKTETQSDAIRLPQEQRSQERVLAPLPEFRWR